MLPVDIKSQVVHVLNAIGRPLLFSELVPLVLGKQPHGVDPTTGQVIYHETEEFKKLLDTMVSDGELIDKSGDLGFMYSLA